MPDDIVDACLGAARRARAIPTLDITGGAPEMHPRFRDLVATARRLGRRVIDRCNLTITTLPELQRPAAFLAAHRVEVVASLPSYAAAMTDRQRGDGVFEQSIAALREFNALGYGVEGTRARAEPRHQSRRARSCRRRRPRSNATGSASCSAARPRVQPALSRSRTCRSAATSSGSSTRATSQAYMDKLVQAFNPATVPGRDVPHHAQRRLGRPALRLRLQPDARPAARGRARRRR